MMSSLKDQIKEIEKEEIIRALKECDWVMARAARKLGITERMIGYKIKKYGIDVKAEVGAYHDTPIIKTTAGFSLRNK
ncbi:MAG: hypothetical protein HZA14_07155 [Nitrospirae bacterium]|nr:hypothetical protein [Nitrospirota bacterium]